MNRNKIIYHNTIPPIKADCLLPKFKIPNFSQKFSTDSTLNKPSHEFRTDALLGMKIPLCDLSIYADCTPDPESFDEKDFKYYQELASRTQKDMLVVPVSNLIPRTNPNIEIRNQREKNQEKTQKSYYRKSPFYRSIKDPEVEEQLKNAFNGQIPNGEVYLLHQAPPLCTMIDRQLAKPLNSDSLVLLSVGKKFLKVHDPPSEDEQPNVAKKAFSVTEKDTESNIEKAYLYVDDDGEYNLGVIRKNLTLCSVPKKDTMRERLTATPVIFQNAPIVKKDHVSHSEGEEIESKENENRKRSSSVSGSQSGSDHGSSSSKSGSSSRSSSSRSSSDSGSGSRSMSESDEENKNAKHKIRVKDFVSDKKEETENKRKSIASQSYDNEKKRENSSSSHSRSPSPKAKSRSASPKSKSNSSASSRSSSPHKSKSNSESNSDAETKKKSEHSSRSNSPPNRNNSSRSGSDSDDKKNYSRSNSSSGSSRSNSPSRSGSGSGSKSPTRSASSDSDNHKD